MLLGKPKAVEMLFYPCPDLCLIIKSYCEGLQKVPGLAFVLTFSVSLQSQS